MKFIPNPAFERLNSVLGGVEALGCRSTLRVEAFSCRKSKEQKRTAQLLVDRQIDSSSGTTGSNSGGGMMGFPAASFTTDDGGTEEDAVHDDRFVYLVSCLNTLYGEEYDFTCLAPHNFVLVDALGAMAEVDTMLQAMPPELIGENPHLSFWGVMSEQLIPASGLPQSPGPGGSNHQGGVPPSPSPTLASECEFFKFNCPECDPTAQTKLWSVHYLIYARRSKLMVSLLAYGEGNQYKDGYAYATTSSPNAPGPSDSPVNYCEPEEGSTAYGFPSAPLPHHHHHRQNQSGRGGGEVNMMTEEEAERYEY